MLAPYLLVVVVFACLASCDQCYVALLLVLGGESERWCDLQRGLLIAPECQVVSHMVGLDEVDVPLAA